MNEQPTTLDRFVRARYCIITIYAHEETRVLKAIQHWPEPRGI